MIYIVSTLLFVFILVSIFLFLALKKSLNKNEIYESWILEYQDDLMKTYIRLKDLDSRGIFEKDDEVGFVFSNILNTLEDLKDKIYVEENFKTDQKQKGQ